MNVTVTASSSRDKARTAVKKTRAAPKNNDHSAAISTVTSDADDEMVDAKPIASVSTEAWNTSTSKKSHSRYFCRSAIHNVINRKLSSLNAPL
jgi:transcription factor MYB, plant